MCACKRVIRLTRVVEFPFSPRNRIMTIPALRIHAKPTLMVAVPMASLTRDRRVLVTRRAMTFLAGNPRVLTDQRKAGLIMIKGDILAPVDVIVAPVATIAKLALMGVLLLVTRNTGYRKPVAIDIAGMTSVTLDSHMRAMERKLCFPVIEVRFFPFILVMTGFAFVSVALGVNIL
jgi:hypothetical protein